MGEDNKKFLHDLKAWFRDPPPPRERQAWTLAHGFYAQMCGFLFYDQETDWPIRVLEFDELMDLIQSQIVEPPIILEEEICDKSKGDFFTKLLVVVQTTWFMVQCIARWLIKLPVTELEIMTFSFAILNLITYALWWEKPQNVGVGMRIRMKMQKGWDDQDPGHQVAQSGAADLEEDIGEAHQIFQEDEDGLPEPPKELEQDMVIDEENQASPHRLVIQTPDQPSRSVELEMKRPRRHSEGRIVTAIHIIPHTFYFLGKGILKAELFTQLRQAVLGQMPTVGTAALVSTRTSPNNPSGTPTVVVSVVPGALTVSTFYAYTASQSGQKSSLIIFVVASGALFGGLHLIPWRLAFPTPVELTLWRISALYTMLNPVLLSFPLALFALLSNRSRLRPNTRSSVTEWLRWVTPPIRIITIAIPLYILARLSIIVLAFTTLRALPEDALREISWSSFFPHI